jgi:hypothetical protein
MILSGKGYVVRHAILYFCFVLCSFFFFVQMTTEPVGLMVAGGVAGAVSKTLTAPLERVKILLQIQGMRGSGSEKHYTRGVFGTMLQVVKEEGALSLFKGNGSNVLRIIPVYALKFTFNDLFRDRLVRRPG